MTSEYGSLFALDSFASVESVRVAVYSRALAVANTLARPPATEAIANIFLDFVKDDRWRLDALDVALKRADRHTTVEKLIAKATEIADWATADVDIQTPAEPTLTEPETTVATATTTKKKVTTKKKTTR